MSVIIKEFNKPKNCYNCRFNDSDCWCSITKGTIDRDDYTCDVQCPIEQLPRVEREDLKAKESAMRIQFDENDYTQLKDGDTYENKFVVLDTKQFKPEYRTAQCQLFYAQTGFGCDPTKLGGKIFGRLYDESYQTRRECVLGVATEEAIAKWEELYGMSREVFFEN